MAANVRTRSSLRAAKLGVEFLEGRDVPAGFIGGAVGGGAGPGSLVYGYEYGDGTAIGWATGSYTAGPEAEANTPEVVALAPEASAELAANPAAGVAILPAFDAASPASDVELGETVNSVAFAAAYYLAPESEQTENGFDVTAGAIWVG